MPLVASPTTDHIPEVRLALETQGVVLERRGRPIARLPDIHLASGTAMALTGASGSGKTTALLALAGIRVPHAGRILIESQDVWSLQPSRRDKLRGRRIGFVFQTFHLIDAITVEQNIRVATAYAGVVDVQPRIENLLDRLDIRSVRHHRGDQLSQGQAQRVAVARALVNRPAIVIADEPTSALDDKNAAAFLRLLKDEAATDQVALLIATHDQRVLRELETLIAMEQPL